MNDSNERPTKRARETPTAAVVFNRTTLQLYERFVDQHALQIPVAKFVGVCAYLCAILKWGYGMKEREIDRFIYYYPTYESLLPDIERQKINDPLTAFPSYHKWFQGCRKEESDGQSTTEHRERIPILDEQCLRQIWLENPYTFLRAELSLDYIVSLKRQSRAGTDLDTRI